MVKLRFVVALLLAVLFTGAARAQDVVYSPYDKFDFRDGDFSVVGMSGGLIYTYRASADGYFLDAYDDSMGKVATVVLDFFPAKIYQTRFIPSGDEIIVLYQALESNKVIQYAAVLDAKGRLKKTPIKLDEAKTGFFGATKSYFSAAVSDDKKTILVYSLSTRGGEITFNGKWIDDQLTISKHVHAVYKADNNIEHGEPNVSNAGVLYIPVYTPAGTNGYGDQYWLLSLGQAATRFDVKELPLDDKFSASLFMKVDNVNNRIYLGGFYANKKNNDYDGILYAWYDIATADFKSKKFIPFDEDLLSASGARSKKRAFSNYQVRQLIVKNDGGFVLISESFFITTRNNYAPGFGYYSFYNSPYGGSYVKEYHYNDVMALSYNGDGNREWGSFVPKEQYSTDDGGLFSSYALLNTGGTLAFMFNDFNARHSQIQLATLDNGGKLALHQFSAEGNDTPDWLPRSGKQVAGRIMVVPCLHKKQICFAKVVF